MVYFKEIVLMKQTIYRENAQIGFEGEQRGYRIQMRWNWKGKLGAGSEKVRTGDTLEDRRKAYQQDCVKKSHKEISSGPVSCQGVLTKERIASFVIRNFSL